MHFSRKSKAASLAAALGLALLGAGGGAGAQTATTTTAAAPDDPFLWLEDAHGARAMDWVGHENAKTLAVLEKDPRYPKLYGDALRIAQAKDRIPTPRFLAGAIYNFWQDADHVRGLWRRTTLSDYKTASPHWRTVFDLDAVSSAEHANWFSKGVECEEPGEGRCLIALSDGGEDAITLREFDLKTSAFVAGGFVLPKAKQRVSWEGPDTLLVSRAQAADELNKSGYPFIVRRWTRGQPLASAVEIFRGSADDGGYGVTPVTLVDGSGHRVSLIDRPISTFQSEKYLVGSKGVEKLALPLKSSVEALVDGRLIIALAEPWRVGADDYAAGSVVALSLAAVRADPVHLKPEIVFSPGPRQSVLETTATRDRLLLVVQDEVRGRLFAYRRNPGGAWTGSRIAFPDNLSLGVLDADIKSDQAFVTATGFLTPTTASLVNTKTLTAAVVKALPPKFDASKDVVEQLQAASSDGVKIPYFVVHPKGMALDGSHPTILTAYGGFQVSNTPSYSGTTGKLWLERGGVYVLANIRGGGEFGPAWHEAGLKTKRQIIYDDFAAVARDLMARGITSPRRLGIEGGSNGGLLMGVEFTQHPELWRAVDIAVPLLDMLRFESIAAGTSWVGEYGSVSVPEERAFLAKISPYNNLKPGMDYPEPFIWTTTKDDRVGPQHARKFAAKLAALGYPYLFYEVVEGGHGSGASQEEQARTSALQMVYFTRKLMD